MTSHIEAIRIDRQLMLRINEPGRKTREEPITARNAALLQAQLALFLRDYIQGMDK